MRAEDLTIGNWVYSSFSYKPCRVLGIKILTEDYADVKVEGVEGWKDINSLTPIRLSSEIVMKNGFEEEIKYEPFIHYSLRMMDDSDIHCISLEETINPADMDEGWDMYISNNKTDASLFIHYVHQLQNALRLCGIDKQIIL